LRKQGFSPASLRLYRAALQGFHAWRGEELVLPIKLPRHTPEYIEPTIIARMLELSQDKPKDHLILRLMSDAGLRREEVIGLRVRHIGTKALRLRGKGSRDRTIPLTGELAEALKPFCNTKSPNDLVIGVGEGVIYRTVKRYGKLAGMASLKPHDLRHSFATRLLEEGIDLITIQQLLGHSSVATTEVYTQVTGTHLEAAIGKLNKPKPTQDDDEPDMDDISQEALLEKLKAMSQRPN